MGILSLLAASSPNRAVRDAHGQPRVTAFRSEQIIDRQIDGLIGISEGVAADGEVNQAEAEFLLRWMETNRAAADQWPAKVLSPRLVAILSDGLLDANEERELLELILHCADGSAPDRGGGEHVD